MLQELGDLSAIASANASMASVHMIQEHEVYKYQVVDFLTRLNKCYLNKDLKS